MFWGDRYLSPDEMEEAAKKAFEYGERPASGALGVLKAGQTVGRGIDPANIPRCSERRSGAEKCSKDLRRQHPLPASGAAEGLGRLPTISLGEVSWLLADIGDHQLDARNLLLDLRDDVDRIRAKRRVERKGTFRKLFRARRYFTLSLLDQRGSSSSLARDLFLGGAKFRAIPQSVLRSRLRVLRALRASPTAIP